MKHFFTFTLALFSLSLGPSATWGQTGTPIARKILALYEPFPNVVDEIYQSEIHRHAEVILNHLGLDVIYHRIDKPLPSNLAARGYRGIVSWFSNGSAAPDADTYCDWLSQQMSDGVKWIPLQRTGILQKNKSRLSQTCQKTMQQLGVSYGGETTHDPLYLEIVKKDSPMVEFERPLSLTEDLYYVRLKPVTPASIKPYLILRRTDIDDSESPLVFTSPKGGFAYAGFVLYENRQFNKMKWRINPFAFFNEALGLNGLPKPDTTTLNGRRLFMTHVDGDGLFNASQINRELYAGDEILTLVKKYSLLPFSLSIITGYLEMPEFNSPRIDTLYTDLLNAPNVEIASHGHAHPLIWAKNTFALDVPNYRYSAEFEVKGSIEKLRELLKRLAIDKPVTAFFWTGDCLPSEQQTQLAEDAGVLNINGGDSSFDAANYDSYAFLTPIGVLRGQTRQIYAATANENVYTDLWRARFYGYRDAIQSFRNTEAPVRIKPIDIYYHYYSGERQASMAALNEAYTYAISQPIQPVFVSEYIRIAQDFFSTQLEHLPDGGFRIVNRGQLKTIRFDDTTQVVDLTRSSGVLGFNHSQGSLYVHLDQNSEHVLYLTTLPQTQPFLSNASFNISQWQNKHGEIHFYKKSWINPQAVFGGLKPNRLYEIHEGKRVSKTLSNTQGVLTVGFSVIEKSTSPSEVLIREAL